MTSADPKSTAITKPVPAIVTAGDSRAAKAVYGKSKVYLEVDGLPLVAHAVRVLQDCPEISAVWVVGDPGRLEAALGGRNSARASASPSTWSSNSVI